MVPDEPPIVILKESVPLSELERLVAAHFGDMVKFVADLERGVVALGGELHADGEEALLGDGSRQQDLWGGNYYPGRGRDGCLEYTSFINIRPGRGNRSMELQDPKLRERMRELVFALIGTGEEAGWPRSTPG